jgi:vacuolar iron transporter family protein
MARLEWWDADTLRSHVVDANDGIIAIAGVVEGLTGAGASDGAVLAAVLAAAAAGAVALAAAKYSEASTERDVQAALIAAERRRLEMGPERELAELAGIYEARGLSAGLARAVAEELSARDALAAQLDAEYGIREITPASAPWGVAVGAGVAFALGSLLSFLIVLLAPPGQRAAMEILAVFIALAATSVLVARLGRTSVRQALARNLVLGAATMALTLLGGLLLSI